MRPPTPVDPAVDNSLARVWVLAALTLAGWMATILWPQLLAAVGIHDFRIPFLDSYAILAAVDAVRAGADPHVANPLDPLMRGHVYSDWWLGLRYLGLTRSDNGMVALIWLGAFGLVAWLTSRPRTWGETFWLASILVSPAVMLAVKRANNDLVIFVLLAGCGLVAGATPGWRQLLAVICLGLAAGLKYFPATGALAFLWIRPVRRMPVALLGALLVVAVVMISVAGEINRSRFTVMSGLHTMGAALWWRDFGFKDTQSALPSLVIIAIAAGLLATGKITVGLASNGNPAERFRAALGAIMLLTCFVGGVSYAYRWIFVIWPALWLWRQAADVRRLKRERCVAGCACGLIALCVWLDGLFCLLGNPSWVSADQTQIGWRHWTQPFPWILMMLLGGWLTEAAAVTIKEWWQACHEIKPPTPGNKFPSSSLGTKGEI